MQMENEIVQVNIDDIIPNRFQPRIAFDEKALNELAASIKEHGIIQPLVLRKLGKKYEIIAGERRYKAATLAGLQTVPAVISNIDDNKSAEVALVENIQRRDLSPIEEARSYKNLLDKGYLTQEQLAKKMGLSQSAISNKLRLLNLDDTVQQALLEGKISERHARALLSISDKEQQKVWLDKIIKERLTVRQLDQELKKINGEDDSSSDIPLVDLTPNIEEIKNNAQDINDNKPKNIANLMVSEDTMTEYSDNLPQQNNQAMNNMPQAETLPTMQEIPSASPFNDIINGSSSVPQQEVLNTMPSTSNKFFNQLEEEPANLNTTNPFAEESVFTINPEPAPVEDVSVPKNIEIFDMSANQVNNNVQTSPDSIKQEEVLQNDPIEELNPNNKFFQPTAEPLFDEPLAKENNQNSVVNPMDYVETINEVSPTEQSTPSFASAINQVRDLVTKLNNEGLNVKIDEADLDPSYQINISIIK